MIQNWAWAIQVADKKMMIKGENSRGYIGTKVSLHCFLRQCGQ